MKFCEYVAQQDEAIGKLAGTALGTALGTGLGAGLGTVPLAMAGRWAGGKFDKWLAQRQAAKAGQPEQEPKSWLGKKMAPVKKWAGEKYSAADKWAEKHPWVTGAAAAGAGALAGGGISSLLSGGGDTASDVATTAVATKSALGTDQLQQIMSSEPGHAMWTSKLGDVDVWVNPDGGWIYQTDGGEIFKGDYGNLGKILYQRLDPSTGGWSRAALHPGFLR